METFKNFIKIVEACKNFMKIILRLNHQFSFFSVIEIVVLLLEKMISLITGSFVFVTAGTEDWIVSSISGYISISPV